MTTTLTRRVPKRPTGRTTAGNPAVVLAIILATYLMIVLDVTVIITGLPDIHRALHFSPTGLSWVQSAYTLTFGGLLLLGARAGDILGRRRVFVAGIALFTLASLMGGLAQSAGWLLAARAAQGVGAAVAAPSTLALLQVSFPEGPERTRAVGAYSAVAGGGGSIGLVLGGMLTTWISWRWGLFINVPIGIVLVVLAPRHLPETERRPGRFDLAGAATSTMGMTALVFGFVRAGSSGWGDPLSLASFAASAVLLAAFVAIEHRAEQPITPLRLFASRQRSGAFVIRVLVVSGMFAQFFFMTQFFQGVLGYSPLVAGLAFLPVTVVMFAVVRAVPRLIPRIGTFRLLTGGIVVAMVGMALLSRLTPETSFFPGIVVPMALLGTGIGAVMVPLTSAGITGVDAEDAGAASGLVNVAQQLGGSLGLAILITVFAAASHARVSVPHGIGSSHTAAQWDLSHALTTALGGSVIFLGLALVTVVTCMREPAAPELTAEEDAALEDAMAELVID